MASGEATEVRAAHARHFAGRENEIMALWDSPRQREAYTWFTTELANLRTAFRWAADHADLDTAATIATYAAFLGLWLENYEPTTRWVSSGEGTYTIESVDDAPQGTSVTLHLKPEDAEDELHDYTSEWKIRELVKKYSDFIAWPIRMQVERRTPAPEEGAVEGGEERVTVETQTVNSMKALWAKSKDEVSDDEYNEFYKHIAHAWDDPLVVIPMKAEGTFEYQALLFIPSHAPFDLFNRDAKVGVQLYVKRVFVMGDCDQLMPRYLRFVKGVVDAQDMSLNVSREILQQERDFADLLTWLKETLSDHVKEVRLSTRLTDSPACLITDTFGITPALARMYRASGQAVPVGKRILELNPKHPLVTGLQQAHKNRGDDSSLVETAELLYGTALLAEGGVPEDPAKFAGLLADRLARTV